MGNLLFFPNGQITSAQFMKGALVLIIVSLLINAMPMASVEAASIFKLLLLPIGYCWIALFMKRYRQGGQSPWMCLVPVVVYCIGYYVWASVVPPMFGAETYDALQVALANAMDDGVSLVGVMEVTEEYGKPLLRKTALPGAFIFAAMSFAIAWGFNTLIPKKDASQDFT